MHAYSTCPHRDWPCILASPQAFILAVESSAYRREGQRDCQRVYTSVASASTGAVMRSINTIAAVLLTLLLSQAVSSTTPIGDWTTGTASFFGGPQVRYGCLCRVEDVACG
eukprot:GHUV01036523.1.p1 GENE.GHUV01036523.1~~GHUV01036523.1.p1  ORF type:complete len:111 (+),score=11.06 GHUV01036523.1:76-408(+)